MRHGARDPTGWRRCSAGARRLQGVRAGRGTARRRARREARAAPGGWRRPPRPGRPRLYCSRAMRSISASVPSASTRRVELVVRGLDGCSRLRSAAGQLGALGEVGPGREDADEQHAAGRRSGAEQRQEQAGPTRPRPRAPARRFAHRRPASDRREGVAAAVGRGLAELLLDAQQLVVLGDPVAAGRRAGLDLAAVGGDGEVGDGGVLGLARAVRHHRGVAAAVRQLDRVERLGERADLVDLDEDRVGDAGVDAAGEALDVGDEQVVADELHAVAEAAR